MTIHRIATRHSGFPPLPPKPHHVLVGHVAPNMDTLCECGARFGMHRVNDHACPNDAWRPGNGKPQWLTRKWERA
jgi:hypothetical protein